MSQVHLEDTELVNERLELSAGTVYFLGPNLTLKNCTLVLRVPARDLIIPQARFIDCTEPEIPPALLGLGARGPGGGGGLRSGRRPGHGQLALGALAGAEDALDEELLLTAARAKAQGLADGLELLAREEPQQLGDVHAPGLPPQFYRVLRGRELMRPAVSGGIPACLPQPAAPRQVPETHPRQPPLTAGFTVRID